MSTARRGPLSTSFYTQDTVTVAKALLGTHLVRTLGGKGRSPRIHLVGRIVETEAYFEDDPASHSFRGKTARNAPMFAEAGCAYVYFIYGNHFCLNVVTEPIGKGGAVLIRAVEPIDGIPTMQQHRRTNDIKNLTSGPGKLCQAFAIDKTFNFHPFKKAPLQIVQAAPPHKRPNASHAAEKIITAPRIGIREAPKALLRFYFSGNPFVSRPVPVTTKGVAA